MPRRVPVPKQRYNVLFHPDVKTLLEDMAWAERTSGSELLARALLMYARAQGRTDLPG